MIFWRADHFIDNVLTAGRGSVAAESPFKGWMPVVSSEKYLLELLKCYIVHASFYHT